MVDLHLDSRNAGDSSSTRDQPVNCGPINNCGLSQEKVIRCFGFEALGTGRSGERTQLSVRVTGAEEKGVRPCGRR